MTIETMMVDRMRRQRREAWQNGKMVCSWTKEQIDVMHAETKGRVPPWGAYPLKTLAGLGSTGLLGRCKAVV